MALNQSKTLVFGHRGASRDAPENTLAAFREAFIQRADGVEGDFHLSADRRVICIHDYCTRRTGGKAMLVADATLAQLRELEFGGWKDRRFHGEPLPVLEDVLPIIPNDRWIVLELKTGPEIVFPVVQILSQHPEKLHRTLVIAFDERVIADFKLQMPNVLAHWLTDYTIETGSGQWTPSVDSVIQTIKGCGADGLGTENRRQVIRPPFIARLRAEGIDQFHVWTVDSVDDALYYQQLGAFAVTSNCPGQIREAFESSIL